MGGGSKPAPQAQAYTPPPIDNSPAKKPIPNFFQGNSVQRPPSPYEMMAALGQTQPPTPLANPGPSALAPLLQSQALPPSAPEPSPQDLIRAAVGAAGGMMSGKGSKDDYNKAVREAVTAMFRGAR